MERKRKSEHRKPTGTSRARHVPPEINRAPGPEGGSDREFSGAPHPLRVPARLARQPPDGPELPRRLAGSEGRRPEGAAEYKRGAEGGFRSGAPAVEEEQHEAVVLGAAVRLRSVQHGPAERCSGAALAAARAGVRASWGGAAAEAVLACARGGGAPARPAPEAGKRRLCAR